MSGRRRLVLATGNPGKLREFEALLSDADLELVPCAVEVEEYAIDYAGNASLKAQAALRSTGLPALGDDSGLEVAALGGFPGLRSRRIAPTQAERNQVVLGRLRGVPRPWSARFVAALVLARPDGSVDSTIGVVEGELIQPRSSGRGFGYDPCFLLPELDLTFGEMDDAAKQRWSHRARALSALRAGGALDRL